RLKPGSNTVTVQAIGEDGTSQSISRSFSVTKPIPRTMIDAPLSNQSINNQDVLVRGWALNGSGVKEVRVSVNGTHIGNAQTGLSRPDVNNAYPGYPGGDRSGYSYTFSDSILISGYNTIIIQAIGNDGTIQNSQTRVYMPELLYHSTYYYTTFSDAVDVQLVRNAQTDLYGNGWESAKRVDVESHMNPNNYLQFTPVNDKSSAKTLQITASSLNVRSGPGTSHGVIGSVARSQTYSILGQSNGWYQISYNSGSGWVSGTHVALIGNTQTMPSLPSAVEVTASSLNVRSGPSTAYSIITSVSFGQTFSVLDTSNGWHQINANGRIGWISGQYTKQVKKIPGELYQFLILSGSSGISSSNLNTELSGKGILAGQGEAFMRAGRDNNINEIYLLAHAFLETGNGTSTLANGVWVTSVDGKAVAPKRVYNMYGIGAKDGDALRLGSEYAYKQGWDTPEKSIIGGAKWIADQYINNATYKQDTLYKMRWNPATPGDHQYATDIGWALKQTRNMDMMLEICQRNNIPLRFDIPSYR
ncbi:SH3 domain-containing protein, partial [Alkalibacter saccharofermentans]